MAHACVLGSHIKGHIMCYGSDSNTDVILGVPLPVYSVLTCFTDLAMYVGMEGKQ